jgi:hypothetical protein
MEKLLAEQGAPAESQIFLGWRLDTRRLQVALLEDKFAAWSLSLATIIKEKVTTKAALDTLKGQLNRTAICASSPSVTTPRPWDGCTTQRGWTQN